MYQSNKYIQLLYRHSPKLVHDFMYSVHGLIKLRQHSMIKRKYLDIIRNVEKIPLENIREMQLKKVKHLINHAYNNVPYYYKLFKKISLEPKDIKSLEDLKLIPTLKKIDVIKNYKELIANNSKEFSPITMSTGGTTGTSLNFLMDKENYTFREAEILHHWEQNGYRYDMEKTVIFRADVLVPHGRSIKKPWRYDFPRKSYHFSAYYTSENIMEEYYMIMKKWRPRYMQALPSTAYIYSKFMNKKGYFINLEKVFTSSEILYDSYREEIEKAFKCKIIDHYGHGEPGTYVAGQCKNGNYHIPSANVYFEVTNEGSIIETSLNNYSMPFIRYEIGDKIDNLHYNCTCGRNTPYFKKIYGRVSDIIYTPDGRIITGIGFDQVFKGTNILGGQIIQSEINSIDINVIPQESYSKKDENKLIEKLQERLGLEIKIKINIVDKIELTPGGKSKLVISEINSSFGY